MERNLVDRTTYAERRGWEAPLLPARGSSLHGLDDLDFDLGDALVDHVQLFRRAEGQIEDAPADEGAAVVDFDDNGFAIAQVRDLDDRAQGQFAVGSGQAVHVKNLAAGCRASVIFVRVKRRIADLFGWHGLGRFGLGCSCVCDGVGAVARVRLATPCACNRAQGDAEQKGNFRQGLACCR